MSTSRRRVCVVTGTRADYGLLYWPMRELEQDPDIELQLIVTGMHLSPEFGMTVHEIERDGFPIADRIEMLLSSDSPAGIAKAIGLGVIGFADCLARLRPHVMLLLGDRFEILAAAQAAMIARIPIAHIHGGESTAGLIDDPIRHSVTKMAQYHFVAAEPFRKRVIQMGERPERVFVTGAPGLDHMRRTPLMERAELERSLGFELSRPTLLVTYHPVTLDGRSPATPMTELLAALDTVPDATIILTRSNADTDGRVINEMIDAYAARNARAHAFTSLGHRRYLSTLHAVDAVVGNSSSGIIEAPAVPVPSINIGDRQSGRLRAGSVVDCAEDRSDIAAALRRVLSDEHRRGIAAVRSPYGDGSAAERIRDLLRTLPLEGVLMKGFHDLDFDLP